MNPPTMGRAVCVPDPSWRPAQDSFGKAEPWFQARALAAEGPRPGSAATGLEPGTAGPPNYRLRLARPPRRPSTAHAAIAVTAASINHNHAGNNALIWMSPVT